MTNKQMRAWILFWQTNCAGGVTYDYLCAKKNAGCDKKDKLLCQNAMKKIMKSLGGK